MKREDIDCLNTLFYNAEEYFHYNNEMFKPYAEYLNSITENIDTITDEDLKFYLTNWIYKNKVYKTININSITVPYNSNMSVNILYGLIIREYSRYDYNTQAVTLHIEYDNTKHGTDVSIEDFKRLEQILGAFSKKKIHLYNNITFIEDLGEYLLSNGYEFIHEIVNIDDIKEEMPSMHLNITDENIDSFEEYIKTSVNKKCGKLYITNLCKQTKNIDLFRYNLDDFIFKYNTLSFSIISDDNIPGKNLYIDNNFVGLKLNTNINLHDKSAPITNTIELLKKDLINKSYISNKCLDCSEKVLCLLGASDERCDYKIF